jgi:hypothetical protein
MLYGKNLLKFYRNLMPPTSAETAGSTKMSVNTMKYGSIHCVTTDKQETKTPVTYMALGLQ